MSRPWMPLYVADYQADTAHLTTTEHGAYLLLIMFYWTKGGLPSDEDAIRRVTRMTSRQWAQSRDVLRSLFGDGWRHKRIDMELAKAIEKSQVNSANALRRHSERKANALRSDTQSQSQSQSEDNSEANASGAEAPLDPSEPERQFFSRGKELLGKASGGQLAKLLKSCGGNVSLARSKLELAATKQSPGQYVAGIIRAGPASFAKPLTAHQQERETTRQILDELGDFISRSSGAENIEILRCDTGDGSASVRGGARGDVIQISPLRAGKGN